MLAGDTVADNGRQESTHGIRLRQGPTWGSETLTGISVATLPLMPITRWSCSLDTSVGRGSDSVSEACVHVVGLTNVTNVLDRRAELTSLTHGQQSYMHMHSHGHIDTASTYVTFAYTHTEMMAFGLVSLGPHGFVQLASAGLIVVLVPGCCWTYSAFSV